jgi:fimbrial chaperone protein
VNRLFLVTAIGALALAIATSAEAAPSLTVVPVNIQLAPGQTTTTLTILNQGDSDTSFQIRAFAWKQENSEDQLAPISELLASPPLGSIAANASQVVRLVLRKPPQGREASYRVLLDQIPPPAEPGTVRIALRLSIPIFAEPPTRVAAHMEWRVEREGGKAFLVAHNEGTRHETVRDITLINAQGTALNIEANLSPYILAGAMRRWPLVLATPMPAGETTLRLTARADAGAIDQPVRVVENP